MIACRAKPKASDETLKQQILANDKAPLRLPPAAIVPDKLHEDARGRALVLTPLASDLEKRLAHFALRVKMTLDGPNGARNEEHVWRRAKSGAFSVKHSGGGELTEWIVIRPTAFVKHNKGDWRKKPFTIEHTETLKRDVVMQLSEPLALFFDGITLSPPAATNDNGRDAFRYKVSYTAKAEKSAGQKTGEAASSATMNAEVKPVDLAGDIVVDKASGVLLTADLKATFELLPIPQAKQPAPTNKQTAKLKLVWAVESLSKDDEQKLEPVAPENAVVDKGFDRPAADVLGFWGITTKKKPGEDEGDEED